MHPLLLLPEQDLLPVSSANVARLQAGLRLSCRPNGPKAEASLSECAVTTLSRHRARGHVAGATLFLGLSGASVCAFRIGRPLQTGRCGHSQLERDSTAPGAGTPGAGTPHKAMMRPLQRLWRARARESKGDDTALCLASLVLVVSPLA